MLHKPISYIQNIYFAYILDFIHMDCFLILRTGRAALKRFPTYKQLMGYTLN